MYDIEQYVLGAVGELDSGAACIVCGSYRRGKPSSGDVDILIYPNDGREEVKPYDRFKCHALDSQRVIDVCLIDTHSPRSNQLFDVVWIFD